MRGLGGAQPVRHPPFSFSLLRSRSTELTVEVLMNEGEFEPIPLFWLCLRLRGRSDSRSTLYSVFIQLSFWATSSESITLNAGRSNGTKTFDSFPLFSIIRLLYNFSLIMVRFYATKKEGESSDKMLVRFKKLLFGSRMINTLRATRYNFKQDTKRKTREKAIICSKYRELAEELS